MKVTLTNSQLEHIFRLIKMKGANYFDVRMEMTDHIASEVEELMTQENLEYMVAVKKVFLRYDRFHFMKIEEEKEKLIQKQSWTEFKREFVLFFAFPKLIITLAVFFSSKFVIEQVGFKFVLSAVLFIGIIMACRLYWIKYTRLGSKRYLQLRTNNIYLVVMS